MLLLCHHPLIKLDNKSSHQTTIRDAGCIVPPTDPKIPHCISHPVSQKSTALSKCPALYITMVSAASHRGQHKYLRLCPCVLLWCPAVQDPLRHCLAALLMSVSYWEVIGQPLHKRSRPSHPRYQLLEQKVHTPEGKICTKNKNMLCCRTFANEHFL